MSSLLLLIGAPFALSAQYAQILKNPDIVWAAETEVTYSLKPPPAEDPIRENDIAFWKSYDPKQAISYDGGDMLIQKMLEAARSGAWPAWHPDDPTKPLDQTAVSDMLTWGIDTIITFDVVTFEEEIKFVRSDLDPAYFTAVRAKQLLYYDAKKGEFGLFTTAVAPVFTLTKRVGINRWDPKGRDSIIYEQLPFWLKLPDFQAKSHRKSPKINRAHISWAAQIRTLGNSPEPNELIPLKTTKTPVMQLLLHRFCHDRRYRATDFYNAPLPFPARETFFMSADTIMQQNYETNQETIEIHSNEVLAEHLSQLRLEEIWYWDDRQQRLIIRLKRFAPIVDGAPWTKPGRPLFYRRIN